MSPRIICPHCHAPVDPQLLDTADCGGMICRICPECDGLIQLPSVEAAAANPLPATPETPVVTLLQPEPCPVMP